MTPAPPPASWALLTAAALVLAGSWSPGSVESVPTSPPCREEARELPLEERLTVGRTLGPDEYTFARVPDLTVSAIGDVWVIDAPGRVVKVYDSSGEIRFTRGRAGEGPGEFQRPAALVATDSSVRVFDLALRRMTEFSNDGSRLGSWRAPGAGETNITVYHSLTGGRSLVATTARLSYGSAHHEPRQLVALRTETPVGVRLDTLLVFHSGAVVHHPDGKSLPWGVTAGPFGPAGAVAVHGDSLVAVADGYASRVSLYRITGDGTVREAFRVSLSLDGPEVDVEDVEDLREAFLDRRESPLGYEPAFETPPRWSVATDAIFASSRELWIQNGRGPECSSVWTVVDLASRSTERVVLPDGFRLMHADVDGLYGVVRTELDVPLVRVYGRRSR